MYFGVVRVDDGVRTKVPIRRMVRDEGVDNVQSRVVKPLDMVVTLRVVRVP